MKRELSLWNWVYNTFERGAVDPRFSLDAAVVRATEMLSVRRAGLTGVLPTEGLLDHGAIIGTAAAVFSYSAETRHDQWASEVLALYRAQVESPTREFLYRSEIPWHPRVFIARALAARSGTPRGQADDQRNLLEAVSHPQMAVTLAALQGIADTWDRDPRFSSIAFNLALQLCHFVRGDYRDQAKMVTDEKALRARAVAAAISAYEDRLDYPAWFVPGPSWTKRFVRGEPVEESADDDVKWVPANDGFLSNFAGEIFLKMPWEVVLAGPHRDAFVTMLSQYLAWTLDHMNPSHKKKHERVRDADHQYEWERNFSRTLGRVSSMLEPAVVMEKFLKPIFEQPDDLCLRILSSYIDLRVRKDVFDAPILTDDTLGVLDACLDSAVESMRLERGHHREGRIYGHDAPSIVESLLFVSAEKCPASSRYANGNWSDIGHVLPLVEKLMRCAGWSSTVMAYFLRLCQRACDQFPPALFADLVLAQSRNGEFPESWQQTNVPSNIAALVQQFADRNHLLDDALARKLLRILDGLVDLGDRRSASLETSEAFRGVRLTAYRA
jgi:hypothetical protein